MVTALRRQERGLEVVGKGNGQNATKSVEGDAGGGWDRTQAKMTGEVVLAEVSRIQSQ